MTKSYILQFIKLKIRTLITLLLVGFAFFMQSCSSTKRVPEGYYLLNKTHINSNKSLSEAELTKIIKQKANRRIFGRLPFYLMVYNMINPEREERSRIAKENKLIAKNLKRQAQGKPPLDKEAKTWRTYLQDIGEKPVILDTNLSKKSSRQLELYAFKKGYFNAQVKDSTSYKGKKATVYYNIDYKEPYRIKNINYIINDSSIKKIIQTDQAASLLHAGDNYDEDYLLKERYRID